MKLHTSTEAINKAIASIKNRGTKLDSDIHVAGCSVLSHMAEHGDSTMADKLVQAMPAGSRKLALVEWMLAFGQVRVLDAKNDKAAITEGRVFALDRSRKHDAEGAEKTSWTEFRKDASVADAFDAGAAVKSVVARLKKATEGKLEIKDKAEALAQAQALVAALAL